MREHQPRTRAANFVVVSAYATMTPMKINVDTDRCTGHGVCESIADDIFEVGDDGVVHLLVEQVPDDRRTDIESAVAECPTQALSVEG
jgi:ferredoxin